MRQGAYGVVRTHVFDADISPSAFRLYVLLTTYADRNNICWPRNETLAEELKVTERRLKQMLSELVKANLIERVEGENHWSSWTTRILVPDPDVSPPRGKDSSPPRGKGSSPISRTDQKNRPKEQTKNSRRTRSAEGGKTMRSAGQMPDDPEEMKRKPTFPLTHQGTVDYFQYEARALRAQGEVKRLGMIVRRLRDEDGLSYDEIQGMMRYFFTRQAQEIRAAKREYTAVALFQNSLTRIKNAKPRPITYKEEMDPGLAAFIERSNSRGA